MSALSEKAKEIFIALVDGVPEAERERHADEACQGDEELKRRVHALLRAHAEPDSRVDKVAMNFPLTIDNPVPTTERPGTQIGPYKLLQQIGEGGFGVVYMAEQTEPVERRVALKIIKPGMDTQQVIARFEAEEQALAMMDHPNIAKVFEVGVVGAGGWRREAGGPTPEMTPSSLLPPPASSLRPYFAMELVRGIPITQYCDEHHLTPRQRLELFVPVCHAIQHAHQKGIIHRDIKPTNVLVAEYDDRPVPKIIDFGVAKAIQQRLTERTMFTQFGQVVGTIDYMSPEQAKLNELDIDTRSDIYSLGVLLYELLTGDTPFDRQRLRSAAFDELLRIIREEEPPRPSTRLSSSHSLPSIAANRQTEPKKLSTLVRGELDWIVMKALEKDRTRRYETANGFASDIQRYLNDEQVAACPPSAAYRFRKFARRNKTALLTVSIVALALTVGAGVAGWQAIAATKARNFAKEQQELAEQRLVDVDEQRSLAERNFQLAFHAVDQMLTEVASDQLKDVPQAETVRKALLEKALAFYQEFLEERSDDPQVRAEAAKAHKRAGDILRLLGEHERAETHFRKAIDLLNGLRVEFRDAEDARWGLAESYHGFGVLLAETGRYDEAENALREAARIATQAVADFPKDPSHRSLIAEVYGSLGTLQLATGRPGEGEDVLRMTPEVDGARVSLGSLYRVTGRHPHAETVIRKALEMRRQLVADFPEDPKHRHLLAEALRELASVLDSTGRRDEAEEAIREVLGIVDRLARDFPHIPNYRISLARSYHELGWLLIEKKAMDEAEAVLREALPVAIQLVSEFPKVPEYRSVLGEVRAELAYLAYRLGRLEDAEQAYCESLAIYRQLATEFPQVYWYEESLAYMLMYFGKLLEKRERVGEAEDVYREALGVFADVQSELSATDALPSAIWDQDGFRGHWATAHMFLGRLLENSKRLSEAAAAYRQALCLWKRQATDFPKIVAHRSAVQECSNDLIRVALAINSQGRPAEAEKLYREVLELQKEVLGPKHPDTLRSMNNLAALYTNWCWQLATAADVSPRDPAKAVELANRAIELRPGDANHWNNLGVAQYRAGDWPAAVEALEKADAMTEGGDRPRRMFLAMAHWRRGDQDKARELYSQGAAWIAAHAHDDEEQQRFRAEAEQLMGITDDARQQLVEQYTAGSADSQPPAPPEPPHDTKPETDNATPNKTPLEEGGTDP